VALYNVLWDKPDILDIVSRLGKHLPFLALTNFNKHTNSTKQCGLNVSGICLYLGLAKMEKGKRICGVYLRSINYMWGVAYLQQSL
jgi:hypothetical protein